MHIFLIWMMSIGLIHAYPLYLDEIMRLDEYSNWSAMFGLALVGILGLFISSDNLRRATQKYQKTLALEKEIEQKHQVMLEIMGNNIASSTKGIVRHREVMSQKPFEELTPTFLHQEIEALKLSETLLLDATHELIDYLKIKSGTLEIKSDPYHVGHMLSELSGNISETAKKEQWALTFDVGSTLSEEIYGDTQRVSQVLRTLITNLATKSGQGSEICLKLVKDQEGQYHKVRFAVCSANHQMTQIGIEHLMDTHSVQELYASREKMDFFVAQEVIQRMGGTLDVTASKEDGTCYSFTLPYKAVSLSRRKVTLKVKNVFVLEENRKSAGALKNLLSTQGVTVESIAQNEPLSVLPSLESYDLLFISTAHISEPLLEKLSTMKEKKSMKVVWLHTVYEQQKVIQNHREVIDLRVQKPFVGEDIYHAVDRLFREEEPIDTTTLEAIKEVPNMTQAHFDRFAGTEILIAEDNVMNQKILKSLLEPSGIQVHLVNNGEEALQYAKTHQGLDLVLMDTHMPVMDGLASTRKIRRYYNENQLPIISICSEGMQNQFEKIKRQGANGFLMKPFKPGALYNALDTFVSQKKQKKEMLSAKLSKYQGNPSVLNIQKGISRSHTAIFYKELLQEVLVKLNESDTFVEHAIRTRQDQALETFCSETVSLAESIGAGKLQQVVKEMKQLFVYRQQIHLPEYISMYRNSWQSLEKEIKLYLQSAMPIV